MSKNTKQSTYNMFVTIPRKSNAITTHIWDLTSSSPYSTRHLALYFPTYKLTIILRVKKIYMFTTNINIYILSICLWVPVVFKFEILICLTHKQCKYGFYQKIVCTRKCYEKREKLHQISFGFLTTFWQKIAVKWQNKLIFKLKLN